MALVNRFLDQKLRMRQMRFLVALDSQRSLSGAARALGMSQPALTKALQELETTIGECLFRRTPQGVLPTQAGQLLLRFATQTLADLERLDEGLDELATPGGGTVVLGALPVSCAGFVPRVVKRLRAVHRNLELRLVGGRTEELLPRLAAGEVDVVVGRLYQTQKPDPLVREPLHLEPISVVARAGHPVFRAGNGVDADLSPYDLVLPSFSQPLGLEIEHMLTLLRLSASSRWLRSSSHLFIREILHESEMIGVMPRMLVAGDLTRGSLRVVPLDVVPPSRPAGLILDPSRPVFPALSSLLDIIRACSQQMAADGTVAIPIGYDHAVRSDARFGPHPA